MGPQFFEIRMGQRFYEHTLPELVRQLARLNDLMERIVDKLASFSTPQVPRR